VIFAHGSGSSRLSPRNQYVARILHKAELATLLMDLLSEGEESDRKNVFDMELLASRIQLARQWLASHPETATLDVGLFGASTGAGAALVEAGKNPAGLKAVVSRGGRPDLAGELLAKVRAPTLLLVGEQDEVVIDLNRLAYRQLQCPKAIKIIEGATHLFEEPGTLDEIADLATTWFIKYFPVHGTREVSL
jgi:putative phosphoribosyl transferase